jgi:hypothetical protein
MSMCSRPVIATQIIAGRVFARCLSCARLSPHGEVAAEAWAQAHREAAAEANVLIGERAVI